MRIHDEREARQAAEQQGAAEAMTDARRAITAIPAVVAAPPGIATYNDLPLLLPRGVLATN